MSFGLINTSVAVVSVLALKFELSMYTSQANFIGIGEKRCIEYVGWRKILCFKALMQWA